MVVVLGLSDDDFFNDNLVLVVVVARVLDNNFFNYNLRLLLVVMMMVVVASLVLDKDFFNNGGLLRVLIREGCLLDEGLLRELLLRERWLDIGLLLGEALLNKLLLRDKLLLLLEALVLSSLVSPVTDQVTSWLVVVEKRDVFL